MIQVLFISLLFIVLFNLIISGIDYFNPGVVFNAMFAIYALLCCVVDAITGLEINNMLTVIIIISGALTFTIVNFISKKTVKRANTEEMFNVIRINEFWGICSVMVEVIALFLMYKYVNDFASVYGVGGLFSEKLSFYDTITKFNSEYKLRMPWYVSIANLIGRSCCYIALYVIVRNYVALKKINIKLLVAVIVYFVSSLMGGRTEAFRIVTATIFLWYYFYKRKNGWRKGSIKIAIRMIIIIVLIVVGFSLLRGVLGRTTYDPIKVVFGYIGASLKNLDTFLSNPKKSISGIWGAMTFTKFINWLGIKFHIQSWIYVSDQPFLYFKEFRMGNVYTTYYNFYYDFGFWGCIILISIIAVYYCYTYRKLKSKTSKKKVVDFQLIIYAYLFNDLIMLPFSSRFYETIVNINFIRIMIILGALTWLINNFYIKSGKIYINLPKLKRRRKIDLYVR